MILLSCLMQRREALIRVTAARIRLLGLDPRILSTLLLVVFVSAGLKPRFARPSVHLVSYFEIKMHITIISVVAAIVAPVLAGPITSVEKRHVIVEKRQLFDPKQVQKL